jgi:hypothetical protein
MCCANVAPGGAISRGWIVIRLALRRPFRSHAAFKSFGSLTRAGQRSLALAIRGITTRAAWACRCRGLVPRLRRRRWAGARRHQHRQSKQYNLHAFSFRRGGNCHKCSFRGIPPLKEL